MVKFYLSLGILALIILTAFYTPSNKIYFTAEGAYALELIHKPTGDIKAVGLFLDPQYGVYQCMESKRNLEYRMLVKHPDIKIVCVKWNSEEL